MKNGILILAADFC